MINQTKIYKESPKVNNPTKNNFNQKIHDHEKGIASDDLCVNFGEYLVALNI